MRSAVVPSLLGVALSLAPLLQPIARAAPTAAHAAPTAGRVAPSTTRLATSDARTLLARGLQLQREASYAASVAALEQARARGTLEDAQRIECAFYLAADYVALDSLPAARRELRALLAAAPDYELPRYTPPKVAALFAEVRAELEKAPRLRPLPPERRGRWLKLRFSPSRTGGRAFGVAWWRWRGDGGFREAPLTPAGDELVAMVALARGGALEYWAEARAPLGPLVAGSATAPLELPVVLSPADAALPTPRQAAELTAGASAADDRPRSRAARLWWLWTSLGVVAATGLGVGLYFALRPTTHTADAVLGFPAQ